MLVSLLCPHLSQMYFMRDNRHFLRFLCPIFLERPLDLARRRRVAHPFLAASLYDCLVLRDFRRSFGLSISVGCPGSLLIQLTKLSVYLSRAGACVFQYPFQNTGYIAFGMTCRENRESRCSGVSCGFFLATVDYHVLDGIGEINLVFVG